MRQAQLKRKSTVAVLLVAALTCLAATSGTLAEDQPASSGCKATVNAGDVHEQIIKLSQIIDPSGKLSKIISDYHPAPASGAGEHKHADLQVAASENEQFKREADPSGAAAAENATGAPSGDQAATTTLTSLVKEAAGTTVAPVSNATSGADSNSTSTTPSPVPAAANSTTVSPTVSTPTQASNVTVNVFLQLSLPDAKTEELVSVLASLNRGLSLKWTSKK